MDLLRIPLRWSRPVELPELTLEPGPKGMQALARLRQAALRKGLIERAEQAKVPCWIGIDGRVVAGSIRLKGDYTDHVAGDKWSLRVELPVADPALGMSRFSVQHPATRGFHGEVLFHATMRWLDVLVPRYQLARVTLHGRSLGIMAVEEHCSAELAAAGERSGEVFVHFDDAMMFHGRHDHRDVAIVPFGPGRVKADPDLQAQCARAIALLRAFVDGELPASAVFDVDRLAAFLAGAELWGSWHTLRWHNLRFRYDPATDHLEPLAFDGNLQARYPIEWTVVTGVEIVTDMLADSRVYATFTRRLRQLCADVASGALIARLEQEQARVLPLLQSEFALLEPFDWEELRQRASFRSRLPIGELPSLEAFARGPLPVLAYLQVDDGVPVVELRNSGAVAQRVVALRWATRDGSRVTLPFLSRRSGALPALLPAKAGAATAPSLRIAGLCPPEARFDVVEVEFEGWDGPPLRTIANPPSPPAGTARAGTFARDR